MLPYVTYNVKLHVHIAGRFELKPWSYFLKHMFTLRNTLLNIAKHLCALNFTWILHSYIVVFLPRCSRHLSCLPDY